MWDELDIPETADPRAIRKAYAARLKLLNRKADDQAFARLHSAYQQAIAWAERQTRTAPANPETPSEIVFLKPAPPPAQPPAPPTPDEEALQALGARIEALLKDGNFPEAVDAYDQGSARGILPLGGGDAWLDQIMTAAVNTLPPQPFMALARRVGWTDRPRIVRRAEPARQAVAERLEAESWFAHLEQESGGGGRPSGADAHVLRRIQLALQGRAQRRNARLLLVDRPQLVRVNKATVKDLQGKMAMYQRFKAGLGSRFPGRAIQRTQWMLDFDTKWGKALRRSLAWLPVIFVVVGIDNVWDFGTALRTVYVIGVIFWLIAGLRYIYGLLKNFRPAWAAWLVGKAGEKILGAIIYLLIGAAFLTGINWIDGEKGGIFSGPWPWMLLGLFVVMTLSGVKKRNR